MKLYYFNVDSKARRACGQKARDLDLGLARDPLDPGLGSLPR